MLETIGKNVRNNIAEFFYFGAFFKATMQQIIYMILSGKMIFIVLMRQILFTGYQALKIISWLGLALGAIIIIQGMTLLQNFGQSELVYQILIIIVTKELGPLLTAFIIIARSGTAISTELGNMVVNSEVEALISIGINPIGYLVVPRVLGVVISLACLSVYFNFAGLLGGYLVSSLIYPLSFVEFFSNLLNKMRVVDLLFGLLKSIVFGTTIAIICSYQGLQVKFASTEVPVRTITAVVSSLTWMMIFNILITIISYMI